ncbi:unnamed protein product [Pleuronectes platessa]|uniref:Uncharacterized protein n=1 Tax=Pleuronectes platessa TaxID=8262 RepID=A0A9N7U565_PLEPL|nr:unnamed protein product [Pleuronectes platessa]
MVLNLRTEGLSKGGGVSRYIPPSGGTDLNLWSSNHLRSTCLKQPLTTQHDLLPKTSHHLSPSTAIAMATVSTVTSLFPLLTRSLRRHDPVGIVNGCSGSQCGARRSQSVDLQAEMALIRVAEEHMALCLEQAAEADNAGEAFAGPAPVPA